MQWDAMDTRRHCTNQLDSYRVLNSDEAVQPSVASTRGPASRVQDLQQVRPCNCFFGKIAYYAAGAYRVQELIDRHGAHFRPARRMSSPVMRRQLSSMNAR